MGEKDFDAAWADIVADLTSQFGDSEFRDAEFRDTDFRDAEFRDTELGDSPSTASPHDNASAGDDPSPSSQTTPRDDAEPPNGTAPTSGTDLVDPARRNETSGIDDPLGDQASAGGPDIGGGATSRTDHGTSDEGLAALFAPLRAPDPRHQDPGAFVDNWADEGEFVPPPAPDLPEGTPLKRLAWIGTIAGPATFVLIALTGWHPPAVVTIAAGLAFLAGFVTLVWQMPESRPDDGWDDGAQL